MELFVFFALILGLWALASLSTEKPKEETKPDASKLSLDQKIELMKLACSSPKAEMGMDPSEIYRDMCNAIEPGVYVTFPNTEDILLCTDASGIKVTEI